MATRLGDLITPEIFTPYVAERTTELDAFLQSGVVAPMEQLNAFEDGGAYVNVPFFKANLEGAFETLKDNKSLTPGKIEADKQVGVVLHRGRAFEVRDLAAIVSGSDPMAAIGDKLAAYIAHERQKDLISCLIGVFGAEDKARSANAAFDELTLNTGNNRNPTVLSPTVVADARAILGDQGDKLTAVVMHSAIYYSLVERRAIDFIYDNEGVPDTGAASGSTAPAFGNVGVPTYMGLRVVVSDDVDKNGTTSYGTYFFAEGAVGSGTQLALRTERDRDILAKSDAMSFDLHYCYHPIGASYQTFANKDANGPANPERTDLENIANWIKVYEKKNIGIVKAGIKVP